jgi:hypothetical protein
MCFAERRFSASRLARQMISGFLLTHQTHHEETPTMNWSRVYIRTRNRQKTKVSLSLFLYCIMQRLFAHHSTRTMRRLVTVTHHCRRARPSFSTNSFSPEEYASPWSKRKEWLQPLDHAPADYSTRHVVQLLQGLYNQESSMDRITTERCNGVLQKLLFTQASTGRAHRSNAILRTMQLFENMNMNINIHSAELPTPTAETYNTVLKIHAQEQVMMVVDVDNNNDNTTKNNQQVQVQVALRAEEIVQHMQNCYQQGVLDLNTHAFHWNMVLQCWSNSQHWEKPIHAAKVFLQMCQDQVADKSSFLIMFRICMHQPNQTFTSKTQEQLGGNVAIKVWQDTMEEDTPTTSSIDLNSHVYAHFLQAIRPLQDSPLRQEYFGACFDRACKYGKVNTVILREFLVHANSPTLFYQYFEPFQHQIKNLHPAKASQVLFECIPSSWTEHADVPKTKREETKREREDN